ncbi:histidine triad (HIT) protein [Spongiactinospora gelatinilytica]|uniref:Histidine triad (HIT) protein n=1 Tax=Spongiactinospora gelatinilytica TaxID=2666298 RepID=A0A2W2H9E1_9ACTN|nr:HIT domain-containing protein [Spongiactinospora gelatinilytica]PZG46680.1 histidine triad (HIT) protein [Spongiactinospora gelatinilytica]
MTAPFPDWPADFVQRMDGRACACGSAPAPGDAGDRIRVYAGRVSDAFLMRHAAQRGYAVVVWKNGHAAEPADLAPRDADRYGREVLLVGTAVRRHFAALKINYLTLGNQTPHLHTNVVARYADDVAPGALLDPVGAALPEDRWRADAAALRALLTGESPLVRRWDE